MNESSVQRLGHRADLFELDQRRVRNAAPDGVGDDGWVGAEIVVTDQLNRGAQAGGERYPAVVIIFAEAVLDEVHGELGGDAGEPIDEVAAAQHVAGDPVAAVRVAELRGGQVHGDGDPVLAGLVPGVGDGALLPVR